jgi:hypothetical protein
VVFQTKAGLGVHRRRKHASQFHAESVASLAERKLRWSDEETYLIALTEVQLGDVRNINEELVKQMPGRTLEAIKSHRKSRDYREVLRGLSSDPMAHRTLTADCRDTHSKRVENDR